MEDSAAKIIGCHDSLLTDPRIAQDFSAETDDLLTEAENLFKIGDGELAMEKLIAMEKKCRQAYDGSSTSKIVQFILNKYKLAGDYKKINEYLVFFNKKRGQLKKTIIDMINLCKLWIPQVESKEDKLNLINTLCTISEGKIFVEVERSEIVRVLSKIKEDDGNIEEAANILQEVQVETFISMDKRNKTEYILEQMRLVLLRKDFIRCHVISRKINPALLKAPEFADLKLKYFMYMIEYHINEEAYCEVAKCYEERFNTEHVLADPNLWVEELKCYIIFLALSPFEDQQTKLPNLLKTEKKKLKEIPVFQNIVEDFINMDLIQWPLPYQDELLNFYIFNDSKFVGGQNRWNLFKKKVMHHNIHVISNCYCQISLLRLSQLLNASVDDSESFLSELVSNKILNAKIDRLHGIIKFGQKKTPEVLLNNWSSQIHQILNLLEESSHLIQKERMLHEAKLKRMQLESKNMSL
ncbi:26S proteasome regulatory subunit p55, putative [Plasmodium knowlesi strain H]|uniref:26S proteasome regulatory subunit p55, putative n=3 Tax=Plasmodium knowlesi TaxID=5850 RepID=A0A5K1V5I8_PLAKH|nr:26S proteasome regulatory subunit p55, putative [Plasmodium knowlesi strain H]OTN68388.1 putative 26S proteasome regulatory subunit p55 [Plasmodium knowlesi]CAA9987071.1 26S proteasome regulatory subunit p55, putative [Plasmodium knowlesi strain H]SBO23796.1 26S proteasome regulatory subunit p55, putative [Plasmodium knowlesi strain H]SBO25535.1 26S proteasome regulatory subunit p55, putative [Plasmodium knowlesi strain H]VVS76545.1 26S proteasome regulatory subunit p55, putative [Plasmodiu|eukprot:XP_002261694.1 26s proteasome subunit p55, putative [Plasmodium knowlesi strain H]